MDETEGCRVLYRCFTEAGFEIRESYGLTEPVKVTLDGFDPAARVGYEYITTAAGDRAEITPEVVRTLEEHMESGELFVLLVDEVDTPTEADLIWAAERFITAVRERGRAP